MKKKVIVLALVVIALSIMAVGTAAYFTAEDTATNVITTGNVSIKLLETSASNQGKEPVPFKDVSGIMPGTTVSKIAQVENNGANGVYVRVAVVKAIELAEGIQATPNTELLTLDINTKDWTLKDGYYYYNAELKPGETTEPLFTTVSFASDMGNEYQGCKTTVSVLAYATQSANNGASALEASGWPKES